MPVNCIVPGCTRRSYQSTKVAKCKVHGIKWALDEELAQVVQVFRRDRTVNGVRTKFTEVLPAAVDPLALTAETLHANNTPVRIVQVRSNAGSEWRAVRVSEWPEDLTSSNVRTLLVYSKSSSGDTNFLPPEIVAGASGISNESAATGIDNRKAQRKASDKSLKDRKESGESTKRRVWTQKYSNENPLCTFSGCTSCANANVAGLPCFPHALADEDVVEVEVRDGKLEVTIRVKTDSLFEDEDVTAGMLTTLVFDEIASSVGGIVYNGKRYECTPDAFFLLANACSPVEIERKKANLRTPLSCPEERKDRNDQWTRNMNAQREWDRKGRERRAERCASALEIVQDRATPERLERGWNVLSEFVARNVGDGGAYIYLSKGTASRSLDKLLQGPHDQYEREMEANETEASTAGFFAWLEKNDKAVYNQAITMLQKRNEESGFFTDPCRGPFGLKPDGSVYTTTDLYQGDLSNYISYLNLEYTSEQEALDLEVDLHRRTRKAKKDDPSSPFAKLTLLYDRDGAGKRIGDLPGYFCVGALLIDVKSLVEDKKMVLNDARSMPYREQISEPFGGYEKANALGYFVEQTDPAYKNRLEYKRERASLKTQLNEAWDRIVRAGGAVKDRCFGSLAEMRRTLDELGSKSMTPRKKSAITPQSKTQRKRRFGDDLGNH